MKNIQVPALLQDLLDEIGENLKKTPGRFQARNRRPNGLQSGH